MCLENSQEGDGRVSYTKNIQDKIIDIGGMVLSNSALDTRTKTLLAIATSVSSYCTHCRGEFKAVGRKMGLSEKEIEEAERIGMSMRERCPHEFGLYKMNE